jgi:hypothetical protein
VNERRGRWRWRRPDRDFIQIALFVLLLLMSLVAIWAVGRGPDAGP